MPLRAAISLGAPFEIVGGRTQVGARRNGRSYEKLPEDDLAKALLLGRVLEFWSLHTFFVVLIASRYYVRGRFLIFTMRRRESNRLDC